MWVTALIGSCTAFAEATLAQIHKQEDPLYGGYRGGPAYYIHDYVQTREREKPAKGRESDLGGFVCDFGLICWCGISQVISNSVAASFRKCIFYSATLYDDRSGGYCGSDRTPEKCNRKSPGLSGSGDGGSLFHDYIVYHFFQSRKPSGSVLQNLPEAFGLKQAAAGGIGAVIMNGSKTGTVFQ